MASAYVQKNAIRCLACRICKFLNSTRNHHRHPNAVPMKNIAPAVRLASPHAPCLLPKPWCTRQCAVGCYCKEGYLRNEQNLCIPATKCKSAANVGPINIPLQKVPQSGPILPLGPGPVIFPSPQLPLLPLAPGPVILSQSAPGPINIPLHKIQSKSGPVVPFIPLGPGPVIIPSHPIPFGPGPVIIDPTQNVPILPLEPGPVIFPQPQSGNGPINIPLHRVPLSLCPQGEEYNTCGVQLDCLASCKLPMTPKCMERMCTPGCVCQKPLVRHEDGRCVEKTECPKN